MRKYLHYNVLLFFPNEKEPKNRDYLKISRKTTVANGCKNKEARTRK